MNIQELKSSGRIILTSVAGSHLYGLNTPASDMDIRGIFLDSPEDLFDVTGDKNQEVADDAQDVKYYSLKKFLKLASECNPNIIELLFLPDDAILFKSPVYDKLVANRHLFMSKRARHTFTGYAYSQIQRAKGLGKKGNSIPKYVNEEGILLLRKCLKAENERKLLRENVERGLIATSSYTLEPCNPYSEFFQMTFGGNFVKYLEKESVEITNFSDVPRFYDVLEYPEVKSMFPPKVENYIQKLEDDRNGFPFRPCPFTENPNDYDASSVEGSVNLYRIYRNPEGHGFIDREGLQVVCHSISIEREKKDFSGVVRVNLEQYKKDKAEYDSFWEWMANRNEARYTRDWDNQTTTDNKNLMHTMRLLICAESIAKTGIPKVRFEGEERDYLMDIRNGKYHYEDILSKAESKINEINQLFDQSDLPHGANIKKINQLYREIVEGE